MVSVFIFSFIILGVSIHAVPLGGSSRPNSNTDWDLLVMTQSWPPAACIYLQNEKQKCNISSKIESWVIHGLWPTKSGTEEPNFCNSSWKFDLSKVQVLRPTLDYNWPSITQGKPSEDTWTHEWEKHGTCGTSVPALKDELHYFNVTLGLHKHYNLSQLLMQGGIIPSYDRTYKAKDIWTVLHNSLRASPSITCVKDKESGKFYLEQIEICFNKSFQHVDCSNTFNPRGSHSDLLFKSETSIVHALGLEEALPSSFHGCGSETGVYFKPMSSAHILVFLQ